VSRVSLVNILVIADAGFVSAFNSVFESTEAVIWFFMGNIDRKIFLE